MNDKKEGFDEIDCSLFRLKVSVKRTKFAGSELNQISLFVGLQLPYLLANAYIFLNPVSCTVFGDPCSLLLTSYFKNASAS